MKEFDGGFITSCGKKSLERYGARRWRNLDWRVCFTFLKPEWGCHYIVGRVDMVEVFGEILGI